MEQQYIGRYRVMGKVGSGGMGTVVRAFDEARKREVAIKLPNESDSEDLKRLRQECDVLMQMQHHHIVEVYGSGSTADTPFFIVMELVEGQPLDQMLRQQGGRLDPRQALKIALGVAEALAYAHRPPLRIIHRDIKPGNVLIRASDGAVKVTDFGIAAVLAERSGRTAIGTLAYMSPEQALGRGVDERSDLYSLGALLYEMLTGQPPPRLASAAPSPPGLALGSLPVSMRQRIDQLVLGLLAGNPSQRRPQQAMEVVEELKALLENRPARLISGPQPIQAINFVPTQRVSAPLAASGYPSPSGTLPNVGFPSALPPRVYPPQYVPAGVAKSRTSKLAVFAFIAGIVPYVAAALLFLLISSIASGPVMGSGCDGNGNCYSYRPSLFVMLLPALMPLLGSLGSAGYLCAIICGHVARGSIRRSGGMLRGKGLATAALVLGYTFVLLGLGWGGFMLLH